jgi:signal transduction histidine kinase
MAMKDVLRKHFARMHEVLQIGSEGANALPQAYTELMLQLVHDLRSPLGALAMEAVTLEDIADDLCQASPEQAGDVSAELRRLALNVARAGQACRDLLGEVEQEVLSSQARDGDSGQ